MSTPIMRIGILSHPESWYYKELRRALSEAGHFAILLDFHQLSAAVGGETLSFSCGTDPLIDLSTLDALIVRSMPVGSLEQVVWRMDLLSRLEADGLRVINSPKALECAIDKYLTTSRLEAAGLPVPATVVCESTEHACAAFEALGGDVVVKPLFGSEGRGIVRLADPDLAWRTFRTLEATSSILYLQRFIPHEGADIRALFWDGRLIGGMKRLGGENFRTNISSGGKPTCYQLTDQEEDLCRRAAETIGVQFAGVDLLYDAVTGEPYILEVNGVPGWRALEEVNGINVARILVDELVK